MSLTVAVLANGNCTACCQQETNAMSLSRNTSQYFTPWSTVPLEKPTVSKLIKKFLPICGTRRLITAFTSVHHLSLSWASSRQSMPPNPTSWRSILILSSLYAWVFQVDYLFPSGFPNKTLYMPLLSPTNLILLNLITWTILGEEYRSISSCGFLHSPVTSSLLGPNTIQPIPYQIFSHRQMSQNIKSK